jgi:hypothetical protein
MAEQNVPGNQSVLVKWRNNFDPLEDVGYFNQMCAEGWRLVEVKYGMKFTFVRCEPGEYICQTALCVKSSGFLDKVKYEQLAGLLAEGGAEIVPQPDSLFTKLGVIAIRRASLGPFEINTDIDSQIEEYTARKNYQAGVATAFFAIAVAYLPLTSLIGFSATPVALIWFIIALPFGQRAYRYHKTIKRLKEERDVSEA